VYACVFVCRLKYESQRKEYVYVDRSMKSGVSMYGAFVSRLRSAMRTCMRIENSMRTSMCEAYVDCEALVCKRGEMRSMRTWESECGTMNVCRQE